MKKSTRIISMLLVLITVVGIMPLSLFAATENETIVPDIAKHLEEANIPTEDIIIASDFNALTDTTYTGADYTDYNVSTIGGISEHSSTFIRSFYGKKDTPVLTWRTDGDNKYLGFEKIEESNTLQGYFDFINRGATSYTTAKDKGLIDKVASEIASGNKFVFSLDIKMQSDVVSAGTLFSMMTRYNNNGSSTINTAALVNVNADGQLKAGSTTTGYYLSQTEWTTVAVAVDMVNKKCDIYVNNKLAYGNLAFSMNNIDADHAFIVPTCMRIQQRTSTANVNHYEKEGMLLDNVLSYYAPGYVADRSELHSEANADGAKDSDIVILTDFERFHEDLKNVFENATSSFKSNTKKANVLGENTANYLQFKYNEPIADATPAYEWVTEADGNNIIKVNGYSTQTFIDVVNRTVSGTPGATHAEFVKDKTLVFKVDVKAGTSLSDATSDIVLINIMTRTPGPLGQAMVTIKSGNKLYSGSTNLNYSLPTDSYATIEVRLNTASKSYDIYANGTKLNASPFTFTPTTTGYDYCVVTAVRMLQSAPAIEGMLYLDNMAYYYVDERIELHKTLNNAGVSSADIISVTDLDAFTGSDLPENLAAVNYAFSEIGGFSANIKNRFRVKNGDDTKNAFKWTDDNGNKSLTVIKVEDPATNFEGFIDVLNDGVDSMSGIKSSLGARVIKAVEEGKKLNFRVDIKGSEYIAAGALITVNTRTVTYNNDGSVNNSNAPLGGAFIDVDATGKLYADDFSSGALKKVLLDATLSADEVLTIGLSVDLKNGTFTVYLNNVVFPQVFTYNPVWVTDGYDYMIPNTVRIYQRRITATSGNNFNNDSISFDNVAMYYSTDYVEADNGKVNGYNLSLEGNIGVQTYVTLNEKIRAAADKVVAKFVLDGVTTEQPLTDTEITDNGYKFICKVGAPQMTSEIKFELYYGNVVILSNSYSVAEYAKTILSDNAYADAQPVVKAMLNYGAMAQKQFGHNLDNLANSILTDTTIADNKTAIDNAASSSVTGSIEGVSYKTTTIGLESETALYHFFNVTDTSASYSISCDGLNATSYIDGSVLVVRLNGITAADLDTTFVLNVTLGEETITVSCNTFAYAKAVMNSTNSDVATDDLKAVMNALYDYNAAANTYFEAN